MARSIAATSGAERDELWPQIAARAPHFAKWQQRIGRTFPVAVLAAGNPMVGDGARA